MSAERSVLTRRDLIKVALGAGSIAVFEMSKHTTNGEEGSQNIKNHYVGEQIIPIPSPIQEASPIQGDDWETVIKSEETFGAIEPDTFSPYHDIFPLSPKK